MGARGLEGEPGLPGTPGPRGLPVSVNIAYIEASSGIKYQYLLLVNGTGTLLTFSDRFNSTF